MRQALDLESVRSDVRWLAAAEFEAEDWPLPVLPAACPLSPEVLLDPAADPRTLAEDLAAVLTD